MPGATLLILLHYFVRSAVLNLWHCHGNMVLRRDYRTNPRFHEPRPSRPPGLCLLSRHLSLFVTVMSYQALKQKVDDEVKRIVDEQYQRGMKLLRVP